MSTSRISGARSTAMLSRATFSMSLFCLFVCAILATVATSSPTGPRVLSRQTAGADDPLLLVNTTSGQVRGQSSGSVYAYKGIPYGNPTGGVNRFRPATMASYSNSVRDATAFGPACPQLVNDLSALISQFTDSVAPSIAQQSEDCLSANVFVRNSTRSKAPALNNGQGGAAVMIWIYGGSFQYGDSSNALYNPQNFVESQSDVIVVTFNYRTNIFGFPLSPQLKQMDAAVGYNRGLEDRDLVIQWVYDNIARFGGDPNRIILWGQSAGGASADTWAFANANNPKPLVQGIIAQSGAISGLDLSLGTPTTTNWSSPGSAWNTVAGSPLVGCGTTNNAAQLQCMQQVDFPTLISAAYKANVSFGPAVDNKLYFDDWAGRSARGQFAKVPMMMGSDSDEGTILSGLFYTDTAGMQQQSATITPLIFTCPAKREASDRVIHGVPTWRYVYHGNWESMNSGITAMGAYHFAETPIVFRTFPSAWLSDLSHSVQIPAEQQAVAAWMQGAWAAFARNPQSGLTTYGWPKYSAFSKSLARIGLNNSATTSYSVPDPVDLGCNLAVPLESALYQLIRKIGAAML
ncbi:hypothetical protein CF327_g4550 [Tilletia walkeri]|nr:hypothetical protein CF327_g4550 [Tilletia walkeri]